VLRCHHGQGLVGVFLRRKTGQQDVRRRPQCDARGRGWEVVHGEQDGPDPLLGRRLRKGPVGGRFGETDRREAVGLGGLGVAGAGRSEDGADRLWSCRSGAGRRNRKGALEFRQREGHDIRHSGGDAVRGPADGAILHVRETGRRGPEGRSTPVDLRLRPGIQDSLFGSVGGWRPGIHQLWR
jgi:hypothetical protein